MLLPFVGGALPVRRPAALVARSHSLFLSATPRKRLWSPTDLSTFAESPWVSWLERLSREQPANPLVTAADAADPFLEMLGKMGGESEAAVLSSLRDGGKRVVVDLSSVRGSPQERASATAAALAERPDVIYQAPMALGEFFGIADFLIRVPDARGAAPRYMVWDAKLARHPRPSQILQLCCYAEMLAALQGAPVERVGLILGATPLILRVSAYDALYRRTRARFLEAQQTFDPAAFPPPPSGAQPTGRWSSLAASELLRTDELQLVARLTARQARLLLDGGVRTATALAALDGQPTLPRIDGIAPTVLRRLARQAALQHQGRAAAELPPPFDLVRGACASRAALGGLPQPHPLDAFFDLEGFPFATLPAIAGQSSLPDLLELSADGAASSTDGTGDAPGVDDQTSLALAEGGGGGREYLWGISTRPGAAAVGGGDGCVRWPASDDGATGAYLSWWAHDATEERAAFAASVDWLLARRRTAPKMHVYHYGAYELSALRRLAGRYGTREAEVDELLRAGAFVDLYDVVRHSLLIGEPRYSIKNVEKLYRASLVRETDVAKGDQSVAVYANWLGALLPVPLASTLPFSPPLVPRGCDADAPDGIHVDESVTLHSLAEYNRDDVESTRQLADWLWRVKCARCAASEGVSDDMAPALDEAPDSGDEAGVPTSDDEYEVGRLEGVLAEPEGWPAQSALAHAGARSTLGGMLRYHRREAKPQWWRRYDWLETPPAELVAEARTLAALRRTKREPYKAAPRKRRLAYEYSFDELQECNLAPGGSLVLRDDGEFGEGSLPSAEAGDDEPVPTLSASLLSLDRANGTAVIECSTEPPTFISALPNEFVDGKPVATALRELAAEMAAAPESRSALGDILARRVPRVMHADGSMAEVEWPGSGAVGADPVDMTVSTVLALHKSYLCVQGPPGAGKTYTAARCIAALAAEGRRVGVMAVSHRAITHLMAKALEAIAKEDGVVCAALKLGGPVGDADELTRACGHAVSGSDDGAAGRLSVRALRGASALKGEGLDRTELLVGGTAWAFASEALKGELDVLFVDEAGQLPLAQLAGAARAAKSIVLLGDQMQLPAPSEGHHPGESGASCLEYLLRGAECVPPSMGVFLPTTFRMHPALCTLVSDLSYRGLLMPHPCTVQRAIELPSGRPAPLLTRGVGVTFVPVRHDGNAQSSSEEVHAIRHLCDELLSGDAMFVDGATRRPMTPEDILVVAPYNLQVRALEAALPSGVRAGTVDRFQGQEAPVVVLSLCHSDFQPTAAAADAAAVNEGGTAASAGGGSERGLSFVLNPNRLNVALSRAQCLAVVVGSPRLADTSPKTLQQQRELNVLCRIMEEEEAYGSIIEEEEAHGSIIDEEEAHGSFMEEEEAHGSIMEEEAKAIEGDQRPSKVSEGQGSGRCRIIEEEETEGVTALTGPPSGLAPADSVAQPSSATEVTPTPAALSEDDVKAMKVVELKAALRARGCSTSGLKAVLAARLLEEALGR